MAEMSQRSMIGAALLAIGILLIVVGWFFAQAVMVVGIVAIIIGLCLVGNKFTKSTRRRKGEKYRIDNPSISNNGNNHRLCPNCGETLESDCGDHCPNCKKRLD